MTDLTVFRNEEFGKVRTFTQNNEIYFIATDVCRALDIDNTSRAVHRLDDDEKGITISNTLKGKQNLLYVNEYGLYSLILTSRKAEAKAFKRWITHEVIPQIRKTGAYATNSPAIEDYKNTIQKLVDNNHEFKQRWKKATPLIRLGLLMHWIIEDERKAELTYAFVKGLCSND